MTDSPTQLPLFLYGSMLDEEVLQIVLGRDVASDALEGGELRDYRRARVPDESYPVLIEHPGSSVWGALLKNLGAQDWARIHFFESSEYQLKPCTVHTRRETQSASFFAEAEMVPGATEPWTLEWWQTNHREDYITMIVQYMQLFGRADVEEAEALWTELHPST